MAEQRKEAHLLAKGNADPIGGWEFHARSSNGMHSVFQGTIDKVSGICLECNMKDLERMCLWLRFQMSVLAEKDLHISVVHWTSNTEMEECT